MDLQHKRLTAWLSSSSSPIVERTIETHLSIVMLADRVYKIRKPVQFPFIDQTTTSLRYDAAVREMARGMSFSPKLYVGINYLTDEGFLDSSGSCSGEPVLVMERAPDSLCASRIIPHASAATIDMFAKDLVEIHARQLRVPSEEVFENILYAWSTNFNAITGDNIPIPRVELTKLDQQAIRCLQKLKPIIVERATLGLARMCHGDLRLDHVYLTRPLSLIDPVDFDSRLCRTDVLAELAFMIMELRTNGHAAVASQLVEAYSKHSRQAISCRLLDFFVGYRALVRAKVEWLRCRQLDGGEGIHALNRSRCLLEFSLHAINQASE